jgi:hypothetical protein
MNATYNSTKCRNLLSQNAAQKPVIKLSLTEATVLARNAAYNDRLVEEATKI